MLLALSITLGGCSCQESTALYVDLRTDLVPDVEFRVARVELFAGTTAAATAARTQDTRAFAMDDFYAPRRIAEMDGVSSGPAMVRTRLLDGRGSVVAERLTRLDLEGRVLL